MEEDNLLRPLNPHLHHLDLTWPHLSLSFYHFLFQNASQAQLKSLNIFFSIVRGTFANVLAFTKGPACTDMQKTRKKSLPFPNSPTKNMNASVLFGLGTSPFLPWVLYGAETFSWERAREGSGEERNALLAERKWKKWWSTEDLCNTPRIGLSPGRFHCFSPKVSPERLTLVLKLRDPRANFCSQRVENRGLCPRQAHAIGFGGHMFLFIWFNNCGPLVWQIKHAGSSWIQSSNQREFSFSSKQHCGMEEGFTVNLLIPSCVHLFPKEDGKDAVDNEESCSQRYGHFNTTAEPRRSCERYHKNRD